jgi:hypothetical protein
MDWRSPAPKRRPVGFVDPCIPTLAHKPPIGPQWIHEIKHDGYRLIVCRRGGRVRLISITRWANKLRHVVRDGGLFSLTEQSTAQCMGRVGLSILRLASSQPFNAPWLFGRHQGIGTDINHAAGHRPR